MRAKVSIRGDTVAVDYDGTCPRVTRNINCPFASTISATLAAVPSMLCRQFHQQRADFFLALSMVSGSFSNIVLNGGVEYILLSGAQNVPDVLRTFAEEIMPAFA